MKASIMVIVVTIISIFYVVKSWYLSTFAHFINDWYNIEVFLRRYIVNYLLNLYFIYTD